MKCTHPNYQAIYEAPPPLDLEITQQGDKAAKPVMGAAMM
jgi:hypothetical protein